MKQIPYFIEQRAIKCCLSAICILTIMTMVKTQDMEIMYCIIVISLEAIAFLTLPFMKSLTNYYGIQTLTLMKYGSWACTGTLITFCVNKNEIGKILGFAGIIARIMSIISNPIFRQIYNLVSIFT